MRTTKYWRATILTILIMAHIPSTTTQTESKTMQKQQNILLGIKSNGQNISAKLRWNTTLPGVVSTYVIIENEETSMIIVDTGGDICALNTTNGRTIWSKEIADDALFLSTGDVDMDGKDEVLAGETYGQKLYCIDSANGTIEWESKIGDQLRPGVFGAITMDTDGDGKNEVIAETEGVAYILDGKNGTVLWSYVFKGELRYLVAEDIDNDGIVEIIVSVFHDYYIHTGYIYCVKSYGGILWKVKGAPLTLGLGYIKSGAPILMGGKLCINASNGENLWTWEGEGILESPYFCDINGDGETEVIMENIISRLDEPHRLVCLRLKDGRVLWKTNPLAPQPSVSIGDMDGDDRLEIIVGTDQGIACIDEDGKTLWEYSIGRPTRIALWDIDHDGRIEIICFSGKIIFCLKPMSSGRRIYWFISGNQKIADRDIDMLSDYSEEKYGTDPSNTDTDGDILPDGWEIANHLNPLDPVDPTLDNDDDGLDNIAEYEYGGDPWDSDTDDDGLSDFDEAQIGTDLRLNDTDGDGYSDGYEVSHGTDPLDPDDYPAPLIVRYWWVPMVCVAVIVVLVVFFYRRGVLVGRHET